MNHILTVNYEEKPAYDIILEQDFQGLYDKLEALGMNGRKFMIISDTNVSKYYLEQCIEAIQSNAKLVASFIFEAGEHSKNLDTVSNCYEKLINLGFDRYDVLVALGGGVVGDLTGFVAATYLRGVRFIQVPTSLLAMVDSSIGGKTGVDFKAYKNMVGAFYQPKLVYMNLSTLNTLQEFEFNSGMGELIKHGIIKDSVLYYWLKENTKQIQAKEFEVLKEMILRSCLIKKEVVEKDPKETGDRALLNFGHTIGHSVEKLMNLTLLHGECVAIGMAAATYISMKRGYINQKDYEEIINTLKAFRLPVQVSGLSAEDIYEVSRLDKKMDSDIIKFILLKEIGNAVIDPTVTKEEMLDAIYSILI
ncbi:3-dehydroquinate synthase [Mobilitalea sibirica]|uniref:3-dehydroquinate synthase n=1 Tax=Mobilitalea sibirica TaxID=1462919 RepID=A0A8J7KW33_9FIRM|nr:3-dehydroquinate synthase [Mobilitalea sibirica]MBH1940885.1 3-dehydroquinate synthase [Mobilitalea sibirica]